MENDFFRYKGKKISLRLDGGVEVPLSRVVLWVEECLRYLNDNPDEYVTYTLSGNRMVVVCRETDGYEGDLYSVYVSRLTHKATFMEVPERIIPSEIKEF